MHRKVAFASIVLALAFITSWQAFVLFGIILTLVSLNLIFSSTYEKGLPSTLHVEHVKRLRTEVRANKPRAISGALMGGALFGLILFGLRSLFVSIF